jgi:hypothetical protein
MEPKVALINNLHGIERNSFLFALGGSISANSRPLIPPPTQQNIHAHPSSFLETKTKLHFLYVRSEISIAIQIVLHIFFSSVNHQLSNKSLVIKVMELVCLRG